jgi:PEP-CTERM motif
LPFLSAATVPTVNGVMFDFVGAPAGVSFSVMTAGDTAELVVAPATPEPGTVLLVGMGVMGLVARRRVTR